jgi:UTP-glucose-1-phosphate uridylyltransferase
MGSRYGGLKQIDPIGPSGEVVLDYSVYDAIRAGFGKVVFIIRRDIEADFKAAVSSHFTGRIAVDYVYQELSQLPDGFPLPSGRTKPWGTTHATLAAATAVNEPFAVINADDFYGRKTFEVLGRWLAKKSGSKGVYSLVGFTLANTLSEHGGVSRGVCVANAQGHLADIEECHEIQRDGNGVKIKRASGFTPGTGSEIVSMNFWGFTPDIFDHLRKAFSTFLSTLKDPMKSECLIPTTVGDLVKQGAAVVEVLSSPEKWFGVTYPADKPSVKASVQALISSGEYPPSLWT